MDLLLIEDDQAYQLAMASHLRQLRGIDRQVPEDEHGVVALDERAVDDRLARAQLRRDPLEQPLSIGKVLANTWHDVLKDLHGSPPIHCYADSSIRPVARGAQRKQSPGSALLAAAKSSAMQPP